MRVKRKDTNFGPPLMEGKEKKRKEKKRNAFGAWSNGATPVWDRQGMARLRIGGTVIGIVKEDGNSEKDNSINDKDQ